MNPITFLATIVGERAARPVFLALIALLAIGIFGVAKCSADKSENDRVAAQAEQDGRHSEAMADSAQNAVAEVINQSAHQMDAEQVAAEAAKVMDEKPATPQAYRAAIGAVCALPEYAGDPACAR